MPAVARKLNPALWKRAREDAVASMGGVFSARAMQVATKLYKARGGRYEGRKPAAGTNSLARWTAEDWGYAGKRGASRYLPKAVRARLTPSERARTNAAKRTWRPRRRASARPCGRGRVAAGRGAKRSAAPRRRANPSAAPRPAPAPGGRRFSCAATLPARPPPPPLRPLRPLRPPPPPAGRRSAPAIGRIAGARRVWCGR